MESLYRLMPVSVALVFLTGWAFWRALHGGQFDDLERPAHEVLMDNDIHKEKDDEHARRVH